MSRTAAEKKTTIQDVATHLGVSKSTVSHALSGRRQISAAVVAKVHRAIEELGYQPDFAAKAMMTRSTGLIGVAVVDLSNMITGQTIATLSKAFHAQNYLLTLCLANSLDPADGRALLGRMSNGMFDGIFNMLPHVTAEEAERAAGGTPVLTHLRHDVSPVFIDYAAGARQMIDYLFSLGHRRIGLLSTESRGTYSGADGTFSGDPILRAIGAELKRRGVYDPDLFLPGWGDVASGLKAGAYFADRHVTAIYAANDTSASGLYQWAYAHGVRVPQDWSILGVDDSPLAVALQPSLTSLNLCMDQAVVHSAEVLLNRMRRTPIPMPGLTITPKLVVRNSTNVAATRGH